MNRDYKNKIVYHMNKLDEALRAANARNNKRIGIVNTDYTHKVVNHTVKTFCSKFNKGTFIITVSNHALTIKDGIVIDNPDMQFTGYRRIVESACEIK